MVLVVNEVFVNEDDFLTMTGLAIVFAANLCRLIGRYDNFFLWNFFFMGHEDLAFPDVVVD